MKVISTFAGCGGSSLGYKMAGCEVVAAVEWDAHAVQCYRLNHPATHVHHGDIAAVNGAALLAAVGLEVGELDVLDGSPPCQGFSTAGQRQLDDPRNQLFRQQLRLIDEMRPRHVVIENVTGMVKGKMRTVAAEIVRELKVRGYLVAAGVLNAKYFGVAQIRERVFFLGSLAGQPVLPAPQTFPRSARSALTGVEPDEVILHTGGGMRLLARHLRPGEDGADVLSRLGRKPGWFSSAMLDPDKPAPTIIKTLRGTVTMLHWHRHQLSIREALVLQGFPPDYQLPGSFGERWARIGNSVCPPVTCAIARELQRLGSTQRIAAEYIGP